MELLNFLNQNSSIISIIIGISGLLIGLFSYIKTRKRKSITVYKITDDSIFEIKDPVPDLKVFYKSQQVEELYLLTLQIKNTGNVDIVESDFVEPLHLTSKTNILSAKISDKSPHELSIQIDEVRDNKVIFSKDLFKTGESFTIKITSLKKPNFSFNTNRIVDLKKIMVPSETYEKIKKIIRGYNNVAAWVGFPQIPEILVK